MADILNCPGRSPRPRLEPWGRVYLAAIDRLPEILDLHGRLIAVAALVQSAIVVTHDEDIRASRHLRTVWEPPPEPSQHPHGPD